MINYEWYNLLHKPPLTPPVGVFAPAWIFLYTTIFIALVIYIMIKCKNSKLKGYVYFILQMVLNILWSPIFFVQKNIQLALLIIILLDITVFLNILEFKKFSKLAAGLLIPYFIWILFATYLNTGLNWLN